MLRKLSGVGGACALQNPTPGAGQEGPYTLESRVWGSPKGPTSNPGMCRPLPKVWEPNLPRCPGPAKHPGETDFSVLCEDTS